MRRLSTAGPQGIQSGWSDVYTRDLDCQFVDVTDVPPGRYTLRADVNVGRGIVESNYDDNRAEIEIDIPAGDDAGFPDAGGPADVTRACTDTGVTRDCGWTVERTRTCTPGAMINVGCNAGCTPALGSCTGDTVLRVCPGAEACNHLLALAQNDDSCGTNNLCSHTNFVCPPGGQYTVLTGGYDGDPATCTVAVSP